MGCCYPDEPAPVADAVLDTGIPAWHAHLRIGQALSMPDHLHADVLEITRLCLYLQCIIIADLFAKRVILACVTHHSRHQTGSHSNRSQRRRQRKQLKHPVLKP